MTPHHIFTLADGSPMRAERLCLADIFMGRFGRLTLRKIEAVCSKRAESYSELRPSASNFTRAVMRHRCSRTITRSVRIVSIASFMSIFKNLHDWKTLLFDDARRFSAPCCALQKIHIGWHWVRRVSIKPRADHLRIP